MKFGDMINELKKVNERVMISSETINKYDTSLGISKGNFAIINLDNEAILSQLENKPVLSIGTYKNLVDITL